MDALEERSPGWAQAGTDAWVYIPEFCWHTCNTKTCVNLHQVPVSLKNTLPSLFAVPEWKHCGLSVPANPAEVGKYVHSHFTDG